MFKSGHNSLIPIVYKHRRLLEGLALLAVITLVSVHPVYGYLSSSKSPVSNKDSTIKTIASKAVITCVNSTIKNALIDVLINRPLVSVNGSIRIDPIFVNHTMNNIMGCINKIENGLTNK